MAAHKVKYSSRCTNYYSKMVTSYV